MYTPFMRRALLLALLTTATARAQWTLQNSHTTASLRGIHSVDDKVAWASGTDGTILRTADGGKNWQTCTTPPDAEKLDFRGIQAFNAQTAIVMSSGKGNLSRLYKTKDGCETWRLVATNPDVDGFWDALRSYKEIDRISSADAYILGDSVNSEPKVFEWMDEADDQALQPAHFVYGKVPEGEGSFAASNSVLEVVGTPQADKVWKWKLRWASQTANRVFLSYVRAETGKCEPCRVETKRVEVPMSNGATTAGIFSFKFVTELHGIAVGGDYQKPDDRAKTAAFSRDGGLTWTMARRMPHGYRSAVAYDAPTKSWITVGPNGTDISTDDGRNWRPLKPGPNDAADADKNWNALSLPFVVGPKGRIGILRASALTSPQTK